MPLSLPNIHPKICHNRKADAALPYSERQQRILNEAGFTAARAEITSWPGYSLTPLHSLGGLANASDVAQIAYKDEALRFGLESFKALGGAYAVACLLKREIQQQRGTNEPISTAALLNGDYSDITQTITVSCATDGNHGRSVAWGAQLFGCRCVIYIHATVSAGRQQAIERYGADVVRTAGNYDDSVRAAAADAERYQRFVVSDTSYPGYTDVPKDVMQGYTVMVDEALQQLQGIVPSHVFVQGGVGGLAAAVCSLLWQRFGSQRPRFIVVEPDQADCIFHSIRQGVLTSVAGDLDTIMAGLACGEVSLLAWEILQQGVDAVITVNDQAARDCMRLLADGIGNDPAIVAGESAVAGLAGFLAVAASSELRSEFSIGTGSRILLFGSEGATDPDLYEDIVGRTATTIRTTA